MRTFLLGNSLVAELNDPQWTTICRPGADWEQLANYVLSNRVRFTDSFVYILVGPVRFTRLHRTRGRRECVLSSFAVGTPLSWLRTWLQQLVPLNIIPILCTVYPLEFRSYNDAIRRERLLLQQCWRKTSLGLRGDLSLANNACAVGEISPTHEKVNRFRQER